MPKSILAVIREQNVGNVHKGDMITPSALKGCTRKLVLERTSDYYEEPPKLYYAVRGSLIHGFLEHHGLANVHTEVRLFKKIVANGREIVFSGQIDDYDADEQTITDYKTMSDKGTYILFNEGAKPEHVEQTNLYAWLCNGGHVGSIDGPQVFWPVRRIVIAHLFMNRVVLTGTKHYEQVVGFKEPKKYRLETWRTLVGHTSKGIPIWELEIDIPEVPLIPETDLLPKLLGGASTIRQGFDTGFPLGVLYERDKAWQCSYCPVRKVCHDYEKQLDPKKYLSYYPEKKNTNAKSNS